MKQLAILSTNLQVNHVALMINKSIQCLLHPLAIHTRPPTTGPLLTIINSLRSLISCFVLWRCQPHALFDIWGLLEYEPESVGGDDILGSEDDEAANPHPFQSYSEMYDCIDESMLGDLPWKCYACMLFHQKVLIHRQLHQLICEWLILVTCRFLTQ